MSAPYTIVDRYHRTLEQLGSDETIHRAIDRLRYWQGRGFKYPRIHGDNIDEGCADGLDRDERETIEEAGL